MELCNVCIYKELVCSLIIVFFCGLIYYKTRVIYNLSKHEPLKYFRNAFLFFGSAYLVRFFLTIWAFSNIGSLADCIVCSIRPLITAFVGFFSTLAIINIWYSISHEKIKKELREPAAYLFAIVLSVLAYFFYSAYLIAIVQTIMVLIIIISMHSNKNSKLKLLYILMLIFWVINLASLELIRAVSLNLYLVFNIHLILSIISIIIIIGIYLRISKWLK